MASFRLSTKPKLSIIFNPLVSIGFASTALWTLIHAALALAWR
jgi:hypothetical protein